MILVMIDQSIIDSSSDHKIASQGADLIVSSKCWQITLDSANNNNKNAGNGIDGDHWSPRTTGFSLLLAKI